MHASTQTHSHMCAPAHSYALGHMHSLTCLWGRQHSAFYGMCHRQDQNSGGLALRPNPKMTLCRWSSEKLPKQPGPQPRPQPQPCTTWGPGPATHHEGGHGWRPSGEELSGIRPANITASLQCPPPIWCPLRGRVSPHGGTQQAHPTSPPMPSSPSLQQMDVLCLVMMAQRQGPCGAQAPHA